MYVINEVVTSKLLGPLSIGGITDTIKNVPNSHEKINDPALHHSKKYDSVSNLI